METLAAKPKIVLFVGKLLPHFGQGINSLIFLIFAKDTLKSVT